MSLERFESIINQVQHHALVILLHFQGEPLLNPSFSKMVMYATAKRLVTEVSTNATLLSSELAEDLVKAGLKKVVVTIDSPFDKDFGFYRKEKVTLSDVVKGIQNIQEAKKKFRKKYPLVFLELLAFKNNQHAIEEFKNLGKDLQVDKMRIKTAQIISGEKGFDNVPIGTRFSRYKKLSDGSIVLKGKSVGACSPLWHKTTITHDGWIVPCCFDKSAKYIMGKMEYSSIKEIWFSNHYNRFRSRLLLSRNRLPLCSECPQGRCKLDYGVDY